MGNRAQLRVEPLTALPFRPEASGVPEDGYPLLAEGDRMSLRDGSGSLSTGVNDTYLILARAVQMSVEEILSGPQYFDCAPLIPGFRPGFVSITGPGLYLKGISRRCGGAAVGLPEMPYRTAGAGLLAGGSAMNIIKAINDPHLFKPLFRDLKTWASWVVFLKALFALAMTGSELAIYRQCTGREKPPSEPFREAWVPTGRRSGKSFIAALVAVFLACFRDYRPYLAPGERAMILIIAADRYQAQVIFRYVKGFLASNPMLSKMVEAEKTESIDLANRVTIQVATCSYRSIRGFTAAAVICDEVAFWRADDGGEPGNGSAPGGAAGAGHHPGLAFAGDQQPLCPERPLVAGLSGSSRER